MRILVTGAAGFVGQHVTRTLVSQGHEVVALQHRTQLPPATKRACTQVITGDLSDPAVHAASVGGVDAVCHLAAYIPRRYDDIQEAEACYAINSIATYKLAAAAAAVGVGRFVYVSTANMYGHSSIPWLESALIFPSTSASFYFVSKFAAEVYVARACDTAASTNWIALRVATPYGPGEPPTKVIPAMLSKAMAGQRLKVLHGGTATYNFVFVTDVAECVVKALETEHVGIVNVSSGEHTTLLQLARNVMTTCGNRLVGLDVEPVGGTPSTGFAPVSIDKAQRLLNFRPTPLTEGLERYRRFIEEGYRE